MAKSYHPPMHTAEHILNQTMLQMFTKERSFSAHLERRKSKCDYHFHRDLTPEEIQSLENRVNEVLSANFDVNEEFITLEEAKLKFKTERLPESANEKVRVINIGDYDSCLCIGEHVSNTSEIGRFKIISISFNNEILRIRFKLLNKEN